MQVGRLFPAGQEAGEEDRRQGCPTRGLAGTNAYLYLEGIEITKKAPVARIEIEVRLASGEIKRQLKRLEFRDDLFAESGELDQYRDGFTIYQIDARNDTVEFTNGVVLHAGEATGDVSERDIRRIHNPPRQSRRIWTRRSSSSRKGSRCCRCSSSTRS